MLIKAMALSMPTYSMSCFKLSSILCKELEQMMTNFWWGQKQQEHKTHSIHWKKMCKPKHDGGMGFKCLRSFNDAFMEKQG